MKGNTAKCVGTIFNKTNISINFCSKKDQESNGEIILFVLSIFSLKFSFKILFSRLKHIYMYTCIQ